MATDDEQGLRDLVAERCHALAEKNEAPLVARHASDLVAFDVPPPLRSRGSAAVDERTRQFEVRHRRARTVTVHGLDARSPLHQ